MKSRIIAVIVFVITLFLTFQYGRFEMFYGDLQASMALQSESISILVLTISGLIYCYFSNHRLPKEPVTYLFTRLLIYIYVFSILMTISYPFPARIMYLTIVLPLIMFYLTYKITCAINNVQLEVYGYVTIAIALSIYYFGTYYNNILYEVNQQNNASYSIIYFLPFILCIRNKVAKIALTIMVFLAIMYSLKRGGFVAVILAIAVYLFISNLLSSKRRIKIGGWLLILVFAILIYELYQKVDVVNGSLMTERLNDIEVSEGSGRLTIYKEKINLIFNSGPLGLIFGHGWRATEVDGASRLTAHNDFLEVLYDFGLIGFTLLVVVFVSLIKLCKQLIINQSEYAAPLGSAIAMMLVGSMVSHIWIYPKYLIIFSMFFGFILAAKDIESLTSNTDIDE